MINSKLLRSRIKESFTKLKEEQLSDKDILPIMNDISENLTKGKQINILLNEYEVLIELLTQISVENDFNLLIPLLNQVKTLSSSGSDNNAASNFYLIELTNQAIVRILENKKNSKKSLAKSLDIVVEILQSHLVQLRDRVFDRV